MSTPRLRTVLAGCGRMGRSQAAIIASSSDFELVGVCDVVPAAAEAVGALHGVPWTKDLDELLPRTRPEVVAVCSHNASHAELTLTAAAFPGVRAIYCEKPMAVRLRDARAMAAACRERGVLLAINHQRRLGADLAAVRTTLEAGAIGPLRSVRVQSPGDLLSDGTHAIDSVLFTLGDPAIEWIFGAVHRTPRPATPQDPTPGFRFGHAVESGATVVLQVERGPRIEIFGGDLVERGRGYQDYEYFGDRGRIWRTGDRPWPNVFIADGNGGGWQPDARDYPRRPHPAAGAPDPNGWRPLVEGPEAPSHGISEGYRLLAQSLRTGEPHPLRAEVALRHFEVLMAAYESARRRRRITLPLDQDDFPLDLMPAEEGA